MEPLTKIVNELIQVMLLYFLIGFAVASLGHCFNHFTKPGMVFYWYGDLLERLYFTSAFWKYMVKPLGYCVYCNTTWIAILVYFYFFKPFLPVFLFIGIVWFFVHLINKKLPL